MGTENFFTIDDQVGYDKTEAHEIFINGKKISSKDLFLPGYEYDIIVKFKKYATIKRRIVVEHGKGPMVLKLALKKLKKYKFFTRKNKERLDGIKYPYEFYADGKKIEPHLVNIKKKGVFCYYTIWVDRHAKKFKIVSGYMYHEKPFYWLKGGIRTLPGLSIPLLLKHFKRIQGRSRRGYVIAFSCLEKLLKSFYWSRKIRYLPVAEIGKLINYIEEQDFQNDQDQMRARLLVEALEGIIGK